MQIVVDNLLTNYELAGKGKLVLLLHGWGDAAQGSAALRSELAKSYQVLAPDLPGFGKTQAPGEAWGLDNYAHFVQALIKKLDLGEPYAVIGHSNGGSVAIRALSLGLVHPNKLVLLASAGIRNNGSAKKSALKVVAKTGKVATIWLPRKQRERLRKTLYKKAGSDLLTVEGMEETFKKTIKQDIQADASQVSQPTLLIFGTEDSSVPPNAGQTFNQLIQNSELHMLPTGHFVHLDAPEQVSTLIKDFLK